MLNNGVYTVSEGANMPTVPDGGRAVRRAGILYGPGKAANAGGVATSGLEMSQNSLRLAWTREEVDARLHGIMKAIHKQAKDTAEEYGIARQLRERRQHRGVPQGRRGDDRPGRGVAQQRPGGSWRAHQRPLAVFTTSAIRVQRPLPNGGAGRKGSRT